MTQLEKASLFKALHLQEGTFVMPNPWDAGSAKILAMTGFKALASTSAGLAFSLGKPDGEAVVSREENLNHLKNILRATDLPVSADLENGYGDDPEICAETILMAADIGLVGGSIEDSTGNPEVPIYPFERSVARIKASVGASRSLPFPFILTARAENYIHGRPDLDDTIKRLKSYADAGADVLYAPGLKTADEIGQVVRALSPKPVNILLDPTKEGLSINQLQALGVKRISLGSTLARAAYSAFYNAAQEIRQQNNLTIGSGIFSYDQINEWFRSPVPAK